MSICTVDPYNGELDNEWGARMSNMQVRILVVDDSISMRGLIKKHLSEMSIENVEFAGNGKQAMEKLMAPETQENPFTLILSDWKMPIMDGSQLLNFVRKASSWPDIPFIMLTAEGEKSSVLEAARAGVTGYLFKPINNKSFQDAIRKAINQSEKQGKSNAVAS